MFYFKNRQGFSYTEVLFTLPIILMAIFTAMAALLGSRGFNARASVYMNSMNLGTYQMEEMRKLALQNSGTFSQNMTAKNGTRFPSAVPSQSELATLQGLGLNAFGTNVLDAETVTYVDMINNDLAKVSVRICYKDKEDRINCEDKNFNGTLDGGEDTNSDGRIDSNLKLETLIARK